MSAVVPSDVFPKGVDTMINDYAKPNYKRLFLDDPNFISDFEEGHAMTECWFTV